MQHQIKKKDINVRLDHQSYQKQGLTQTPTIHLGAAAQNIERRGGQSRRGETNRAILKLNYQKAEDIKNEFLFLEAQKDQQKNILSQTQNYLRQSTRQQQDLKQIAAIIKQYQEKIGILQAQYTELGVLALSRKERLAAHIKHFEYAKRQVIKTLHQVHAITPEQIGTVAAHLGKKITALTLNKQAVIQAIAQIDTKQKKLEAEHIRLIPTPDKVKSYVPQAQPVATKEITR